jgi:hypothetical protein
MSDGGVGSEEPPITRGPATAVAYLLVREMPSCCMMAAKRSNRRSISRGWRRLSDDHQLDVFWSVVAISIPYQHGQPFPL